jgi:DNA polymerase III alpha subunit (gram-positive type)
VSSHKPDNTFAKDLCFLDVETTGTIFGYHEVIDIAALRTTSDGLTILGRWQKRIRPRHSERISTNAQTLNGYTPALWENTEESTALFWNEFIAFVKNCVPVCHNPSFDRAFITLGAAEHGIIDLGLHYHWIGTESLAWPLYKQGILPGLSLESLCRFFKVDIEQRPHTAISGAFSCWRVYQLLMKYLIEIYGHGRFGSEDVVKYGRDK